MWKLILGLIVVSLIPPTILLWRDHVKNQPAHEFQVRTLLCNAWNTIELGSNDQGRANRVFKQLAEALERDPSFSISEIEFMSHNMESGGIIIPANPELGKAMLDGLRKGNKGKE
jgi:hypothetical protein